MTTTLTRDFVYTDHVKTNSSVISDLYYDANERLLVVVLHSGVKAGYENVPHDVFSAFAAENTSFWGSVGAYWNKWVKNYFTGFDTSAIESFVSVNDMPVLTNVSAADDEPTTEPENQAVEEEDVTAPQVLWTVGFIDEDSIENELTVYADGILDAVDKVLQIATIAGWVDVQVLSIFKE